MITSELGAWCEELVSTGVIPRDDDEGVDREQAGTRIHRYVELLDMVDGSEPQPVFQAIIDSIQSRDDHGAYESAYDALWRFPPDRFARCFVPALPGFIRRHDDAGRFLLGLVGHGRGEYLPSFNQALAEAPVETRRIIGAYIAAEERHGWFEQARGLIRPVPGEA